LQFLYKFDKTLDVEKFHSFLIIFLILLGIPSAHAQEDTLRRNEAPAPGIPARIKVEYKYVINRPDGPVPMHMVFHTRLLIDRDSAQYIHRRPLKIFKKDNFQIKVNPLYYINNYHFRKDSMREYRYKDGVFLMAEWKPDYEWKITDETKYIQGYKVRKAVTRSIEIPPDKPSYYGKVYAWFTDEIPIPAGPERYVGLPGLILEIEYEKAPDRKITLDKIIFNPPELEIIEIENAIKVKDPRDVIYFLHQNPQEIQKRIKKAKKERKKRRKKSGETRS